MAHSCLALLAWLATSGSPLSDLLSLADASGRPGDSVEYRLIEGGSVRLEIRATVVANDADPDAPGWLELVIPRAALGVRTTWPRKPGSRDEMMIGPDVLELPTAPAAAQTTCRNGRCRENGVSKRGSEALVRTPAGEFRCRRVERKLPRGEIAEVFHSNRVPIFGLVRAKLPGGRELVLTRIAQDGTQTFPAGGAKPWPYAEGGLVSELLEQMLGRGSPTALRFAEPSAEKRSLEAWPSVPTMPVR